MSSFKEYAKNFLERRGWYLRKTRGLPVGINLFLDLSRIKDLSIHTIFDVGAHHGETAVEFARHNPGAAIYSFEPVTENFVYLAAATDRWSEVRCFQLAFGEKPGRVTIELQADSQTHSLRKPVDPDAPATRRTEEITVATIDEFMKSERLERLSLLKIDSEGYELPILLGATAALTAGRIDLLLLEASLDPNDRVHSSLPELERHLRPLGYFLAGLYDQAITPDPTRLAYFNALFVNQRVNLLNA
jgi:FkbM family methyltransferase